MSEEPREFRAYLGTSIGRRRDEALVVAYTSKESLAQSRVTTTLAPSEELGSLIRTCLPEAAGTEAIRGL